MLAGIYEEIGGRGAGALLGLIAGSLITWLLARWKRLRERRNIFRGDARDTIVIHHHLIETAEHPDQEPPRRPVSLRIRGLGQAELDRVVPNGHLASVLLHRAFRVTNHDTLISMEGPEGSYLLETLTNFVCDRVANSPFEHDLYVMAACCEPAGLAEHQPITILLIAVSELALFESWPACRDVLVEHGADGIRVLTLMEMAKRFRREQAQIAELRDAGKRTRFVETMYILDLPLDKRSAPVPLRSVPWGRYEEVLAARNLE
jgi:hypothetical protein